MVELRALAPDLEGDLDELARRTGRPRAGLEEARDALRLAGLPGLAALGLNRRLEPTLEEFHRQRIQAWLERELAGWNLEVRDARGRVTVRVDGRDRFQLRFVPDGCRWFLFQKRGRSWRLWLPPRPCLSLTDWLGQVRQELTRERKSPSERALFDTPQGL